MTTNSPKAAHYNSVLGAALLAGAWAATSSAAAPDGTRLDWAELIRKWAKHTGGSGSAGRLNGLC